MPLDPAHDTGSSADAPDSLAVRRKRSLLARASHGLKRRLTRYRVLTVAALVALATLGAYTLLESTDTEAVLLGTGRASVDGLAEAPGQLHSEGRASFYGEELAGNPTASGERFDPEKLTAAHRTLPLGSRVRVTNLRNGESVVVRINDRGPFHGNRIIDLSEAAARQIGMLKRGTARVQLELLARM